MLIGRQSCKHLTLRDGVRDPPQLRGAKKTRIEKSIRVLKSYPAGAVKVDHPFPFGKRRTTVGAGSDFQLRLVILRAT